MISPQGFVRDHRWVMRNSGNTETLAQLRGFPAGPELEISARFSLTSKRSLKKRFCGINVSGNEYTIKISRKYYLALPQLRLTLGFSQDGEPEYQLAVTGDTKDNYQLQVKEKADCSPDGEYEFRLSLKSNRAEGKITDSFGKTVYHAILSGKSFASDFARAFPGFVSRGQLGSILSFRADNGNSGSGDFQKVIPLKSIPEEWELLRNGKKQTVQLKNGFIDIAEIFGKGSRGRACKLTADVEADRNSLHAITLKADWFWKLTANGITAADCLKRGANGKFTSVVMPLKRGKNRIEIELKSGSKGWNITLRPTEKKELADLESETHLYGSDRLRWNLDRLIDDLKNLKRWDIALPETEKGVLDLRRTLSPETGRMSAMKYDKMLDRWYLDIYNAYRLVHFDDLVKEYRGLGGEKDFSSFRTDLKNALNDPSEFEKIVNNPNRIGQYSSGDGLLVNQVLAGGSLLRQTAFRNGKPWLLNFAFSGERDSKIAEKLSSEPVAGISQAIEFGYDPDNFYSGSTPKEVTVRNISWVRKRFSWKNDFTADMSMLSPALLLESSGNTLTLDLSSGSPLTDFGYRNSSGEIVSKQIAPGVLYDQKKDGKFARNWVLFWSRKNEDTDLAGHKGSVPVQVIFQRQPRLIESADGKLVIHLGKNGAVWLNTPFGTRLQPAGNWGGNLPPTAVGRCDVHGEMALAYPVAMREYFRIAPDRKSVEIRDVTEFRLFDENDWNLVPRKVTMLPPPLILLADRGMARKLPEKMFDTGYPTIYGPLYAVEGSEVTYSIPSDEVPVPLVPRNMELAPERMKLLADPKALKADPGRIASNYVSRGSDFSSLTWSSLRQTRQYKPWSYYPDEARDYLAKENSFQMEWRQSFREHRFIRMLCEPYSGAKYYFSFSIGGTKKPGSVGVFGDRGYGVGLTAFANEQLTALSGDYETLRRLWRDDSPLASPMAVRDGRTVTFDKFYGYFKNVHDWAWMDCGSNDCGDNGPVVDCGQAVFAGHASMHRMAERIGNQTERDWWKYLLAKSQFAISVRPACVDYGRENGWLGMDHINTGSREFITPNSYANSPMIAKTPRQEYDGSIDSLLSYALDDGFDIYAPYTKYVWKDLVRLEALRSIYWPNRDRGIADMHVHLFSRIYYLLLSGVPQSKVEQIYDHWMKTWTKGPSGSYRQMTKNQEFLPYMLTDGCPVMLTDWRLEAAPHFDWYPSRELAEIVFGKSVPAMPLTALSSLRPVSITVDGKNFADWTYDPESYVLQLNLPAGSSRISMQFKGVQRDRFQPYPLPKLKTPVPGLPGLDALDFRSAKSKVSVSSPSVSLKISALKYPFLNGKIERLADGGIRVLAVPKKNRKDLGPGVISTLLPVSGSEKMRLKMRVSGNTGRFEFFVAGKGLKRLNLGLIQLNGEVQIIEKEFTLPETARDLKVFCFVYQNMKSVFEIKEFQLEKL